MGSFIIHKYKMAASFIFCILLSFYSLDSVLSAKIMGFSSMAAGSHYFIIRKTMEELSSRGHEVALIVSSDVKISSNEKLPHFIYKVPYETGFSEELLVKPAIDGNQLKGMWALAQVEKVMCECLLNDTKLLQELKDFDLLVYEGAALCAVLLGEHLEIPRVVIAPGPPNAAFAPFHMIPTPVSYVPQQLTGFTCNMTFIERVINLGVYFAGQLLLKMMFSESVIPLKTKFHIKPEISYEEAVTNVELVIILADFSLEYPQPLLPGVVMVGPIGVKKPGALPPDLQEFLQDTGGHGFIIVSFGSYVEKIIPKEKIDMMAAAFAKLKQKVLWRQKGYSPASLSTNIKVVEWLPQNDLLGHKDIKAFVSHVGFNSVYESAYHGVPVVAVPLFADQFSNAKKVEQFGLGIVVDYKIVYADQLFEAIEQVITEPRFKREATRISRLMQDKPWTPLETTCDWIEYVLRHGGARHLRAQVFNIPWYQYYLLDVIAFLVVIVTLVVMVIRLTCRCLCWFCCNKCRGAKTKRE